MIRWKYALPRLLLVLTVILLVCLALNPLLHWAVETAAEQVLSMRVDVGDLDASLKNSEIHIRDFAVADPGNANRNLFDADAVSLSFDTNALLRRKFVVREGRVQGLRLHEQRDETAPPVDHWQWNVKGDRLEQQAKRWLKVLSTTLGEELEEEISELESVQLAKELLENWPEEYEQLEARVHAMKARVENLRTLFRTRPKDLASGLRHYQKTLAEVEQLEQEMVDVAERIDELPDRIESDREAILAASERDIRKIEKRFELIRLDEETITSYFLGPEIGRRVVTITEWVRWARSHLPEEDPDFGGNRLPGMNVLFAGRRHQPDFLIESLRVDGETTIRGRPYSFAAAASGLTAQPKLYGRPAEIRAQLVGDVAFAVHASIDRSGETPVDRIVIDCPNLSLPEMSLGREEAVALAFHPGNTHLWVGVNLTNDRITGTVLVKQSGGKLTPTFAESLGGRRLADNLASATESLEEIEIQVDLAGPLDQPRWVLRSSLGEDLREGLNRAAVAEIAYRRDQAARLVQERVDKELNKVRNRLATDEEILMSRLKLSESEVQQLGKRVAQKIPSADRILSKALGGRARLR